eukprot:TRINITY_DN45101_c0_g1_i1.p1 TRINITY_DN45101_c0_g1~~TRINITY_DN45101_c0_g1_i1.p1  ORF type:complete len:699 (+),score=107.11 TRINITY_DN45101_c0_g1_i1:103-2199(+)
MAVVHLSDLQCEISSKAEKAEGANALRASFGRNLQLERDYVLRKLEGVHEQFLRNLEADWLRSSAASPREWLRSKDETTGEVPWQAHSTLRTFSTSRSRSNSHVDRHAAAGGLTHAAAVTNGGNTKIRTKKDSTDVGMAADATNGNCKEAGTANRATSEPTGAKDAPGFQSEETCDEASPRSDGEELTPSSQPATGTPSQGTPTKKRKQTLRKRTSIREGSITVFLRRLMDSWKAELIFAALIVLNTATMALELQYTGMEHGYNLESRGSTHPAEENWPGVAKFLEISEYFFGVAFTLEVVLKFFGHYMEFFYSLWNLYDLFIVGFWLVSLVAGDVLIASPFLLRLVRMARLMRMAKLFRAFQVFDVLHLLTMSLRASVSALFWSGILLAFLMLANGLILGKYLESYFYAPDLSYETRLWLYQHFGSFSRCMFTMMELTFANWAKLSREVIENISEWFALYIMVYRLIVSFAVVKVISGIFLHETFRCAAADDEIMIMQRERQIKKHVERMQTLLEEGDESNDGFLNQEEFRDVCADPRIKKWLEAQEIFAHDADMLFAMIDVEGDNHLTAEELCRGFARLKGPARAFDMHVVMDAVSRLESRMSQLDTSVARYSRYSQYQAPPISPRLSDLQAPTAVPIAAACGVTGIVATEQQPGSVPYDDWAYADSFLTKSQPDRSPRPPQPSGDDEAASDACSV